MNLAVKAAVGIVGAPLIYFIPDRLDRFEELDKPEPPRE